MFKHSMDIVCRLLPGCKVYPRVLQFPITGRCNSLCKICNVPALSKPVDITADKLRGLVEDPLLRKVESVGINGGEPFLVKDLPEIIDVVLTLPAIRSVNIITNGLLSTRVLSLSREIVLKCREQGVIFSLSVSLDGVGEVNDICRGVKGAFERTNHTISTIMKAPKIYCDNFSVGCTVSRFNVDNLVEIDAFCNDLNYPVFYRLAVGNRRIHTENSYEGFSVLFDEKARQSAMEFFYGKIIDKCYRNLREKIKYYIIFKYLESKGKNRLAGCFWKWRDATIDEQGRLYYCATQSKSLGVLDGKNGKFIFFDSENLNYRESLSKACCNECIHYAFFPNFRGAISCLLFVMHWVLFSQQYKLKRRFL